MNRLKLPGPDDHVRGNTDAPVTLIEYGDYECPYCGRAHPAILDALRRMGSSVRFVYRHFPLTEMHRHALQAAEAAEAAGAQGRFWDMHDLLYENQAALGLTDLYGYAAALGLDQGRFQADLATHAHLGKIERDFNSGVRSGVNGTPTLFIQGMRYEGSRDPDALTAALQSALGRAAA
ncbi:thioredoxin domain-containing protein [Polyangium sp. y55x31]|uniref:DsbA family protein n=1 Tax=Polyangium sp. y55x31 TaxID=3042688 RepID=UPI002482A0AD|nr:thioredoxin domain-containing protein [Polyangium sp. y55x31]MDI1478177.1 thioredoxin domain-containing protein [Polyangium sp. y55x31]